MSHVVEVAAPADFLGVAALDRIAWPAAPETFIPDGEHIWRVWCEHGTLLVARAAESGELADTGGIAGALVMFPTGGGETFLHKIMVHPGCRAKGIGTALMREALGRAETPVLLTVDPANAHAVALYRGFGFEVRETIAGFYRPHEDRHVMVHPGRAGL
jgi:[ribosomal protein S18]-alanine N-acetyltransferase